MVKGNLGVQVDQVNLPRYSHSKFVKDPFLLYDDPDFCIGDFSKLRIQPPLILSLLWSDLVSVCILKYGIIGSVRLLSRVQLFATPWTAAHKASLSISNCQSLLKPMFIESEMPSNHLILYHPLLLMPSVFPSIRVFSNESALHLRWPKYWSFSFNISPSNEHPGLISFRMDWLDLFAVQGTLKSLLQPHSSKASILQRSAFFTVQLSHPYMTTGKTIALTNGPFLAE